MYNFTLVGAIKYPFGVEYATVKVRQVVVVGGGFGEHDSMHHVGSTCTCMGHVFLSSQLASLEGKGEGCYIAYGVHIWLWGELQANSNES